MWLRIYVAVTVFRQLFLRWCGACYCSDSLCPLFHGCHVISLASKKRFFQAVEQSWQCLELYVWLVMKIIVMSVDTIPGNCLILVFPEGKCPDKFCNCYFPQMFCYWPLSCCSVPPFCKNKRTEQPQFVYLPEVKSVSEWGSESVARSYFIYLPFLDQGNTKIYFQLRFKEKKQKNNNKKTFPAPTIKCNFNIT